MIIILGKFKPQKVTKRYSAISCWAFLPIVKANTPNKRIYQLSHGNNWDSTPVFKVLGPTLTIQLLHAQAY